MKYSHLALGGTFDHLHTGHISLISYAFRMADGVTIGIMTDDYITKKNLASLVQPYPMRTQAMESFLRHQSFLARSRLVPLQDIYGPVLTDPTIQALVVTAETAQNGRIIQRERTRLGLPHLELCIVPLVKGTDNKIIRAERIRQGIIDRTGTYYWSFFRTHRHLVLPAKLRTCMREPLGTVFSDETKFFNFLKKTPHTLLISVGDIVTQTLRAQSVIPQVSVVDYKTRRYILQKPRTAQPIHFIHNKPGSIQIRAVATLRHAVLDALQMYTKTILSIEGEEDLLSLPAILLAPLQSLVVYGQYDKGIVVTQVTEKNKKLVFQLLKQFQSR